MSLKHAHAAIADHDTAADRTENAILGVLFFKQWQKRRDLRKSPPRGEAVAEHIASPLRAGTARDPGPCRHRSGDDRVRRIENLPYCRHGLF